MIRKSLATKIGLSIMGLVLIVILALYLSLGQLFRDVFYRQVGDELLAQGKEYAQMAAAGGPMMMQMMCTTTDAALFILDTAGRPVAKSPSVTIHPQNASDQRAFQAALQGQSITRYGYSGMFNETGVLVMTPITQGDSVIGVVALFRPEHVISSAFRHIEWLLVLAGAGSILLAIGLTLGLSKRIARPLQRMAIAARELGKGNYKMKIPIEGEDEVARLGIAINDLAADLNHLQTSRNEFLADVSHELRTPLSYIRGYSQVLIEDLTQSPDEKEQYLEIIHSESKRIERLVNDLFTLAQTDEGVLKTEKEPAQLERIVQETVERMKQRAKDKGVSVHLSLDTFPEVFVDPDRIEQVMFNLLDNAIRYTGTDGVIWIRMSQSGGVLEVAVTDTGIGIPKDELPHIWDRLYRVEKSRSRERGGTGLGLAIVKQIVELHGGTVWAESTDQVGTTIAFTIPIEGQKANQKGDRNEED